MRLRTGLAITYAGLALVLWLLATIPLAIQTALKERETARDNLAGDLTQLAGAATLQWLPGNLDALAASAVQADHSAVVFYEPGGRRIAGGGPRQDLAGYRGGSGRVSRRGYDTAWIEVGGADRRLLGTAVIVAPQPGVASISGSAFFWLVSGLVAVAVAGAGGWILASRIARPLDELADATFRLAMGDRKTRVRTDRTFAELAVLASSLDSFAEHLDRTTTEQAQREELRRKLLRQVSHRLRTPLGVLALRTEALEDGTLDVSQQVELGAILAAQIAALEHGTAAIMDLARSGRMDEPEEQDLAVVVRHEAERARALARWNGVRIRLGRLDPATVCAGPAQLQDAAAELLVNAVKFSPRGTVIDVTVGTDDGCGVLTVTDRGPGIPEAERVNVLLPFERGSNGARAPGTGLGLALVAETAARSGGGFRLEGREGGGTTAVLKIGNRIPAADSPPA